MADREGTRRRFLRGLAGLGAAGFAGPTWPRLASAAELPLTPACGEDPDLTPHQTEGPYFTPDSPERAVLREPGIAGTPIVLAGTVLGRDCRPISGALVDLWHCDDAATMTTAAMASAATSSPAPTATIASRPSSPVSIRAGPGISTSSSRPRAARCS